MAQRYLDFIEPQFTNAQSPPSGFTVRHVDTGTTVWQIIRDEQTGQIQHTSNAAARRTLSWTEVGSVSTPVEFLVRFRTTSFANNAQQNAIRVCVSGAAGFENAYFVEVQNPSNTPSIAIRRYINGTLTELQSVPKAFTINTNYWMCIRFDPSTGSISADTWPDGAAEPVSYALSVTDANLTSGEVAFGAATQTGTRQWSVASLGTDSDPAPRKPKQALSPLWVNSTVQGSVRLTTAGDYSSPKGSASHSHSQFQLVDPNDHDEVLYDSGDIAVTGHAAEWESAVSPGSFGGRVRHKDSDGTYGAWSYPVEMHVGAATGQLIGIFSAPGTSCPVPAHAADDIVLVVAYRSGSNTSPTLAAGYTNLIAAGAGNNSMRVARLLATGDAHTSGTWNSANRVMVMVFRGLPANVASIVLASNTGGDSTGTVVLAASNGNHRLGGDVIEVFGHRTATQILSTSGVGDPVLSVPAPFMMGAFIQRFAAEVPAGEVVTNGGTTSSDGYYSIRFGTLPAVEDNPRRKEGGLVATEDFATYPDGPLPSDKWEVVGSGTAVIASGQLRLTPDDVVGAHVAALYKQVSLNGMLVEGVVGRSANGRDEPEAYLVARVSGLSITANRFGAGYVEHNTLSGHVTSAFQRLGGTYTGIGGTGAVSTTPRQLKVEATDGRWRGFTYGFSPAGRALIYSAERTELDGTVGYAGLESRMRQSGGSGTAYAYCSIMRVLKNDRVTVLNVPEGYSLFLDNDVVSSWDEVGPDAGPDGIAIVDHIRSHWPQPIFVRNESNQNVAAIGYCWGGDVFDFGNLAAEIIEGVLVGATSVRIDVVESSMEATARRLQRSTSPAFTSYVVVAQSDVIGTLPNPLSDTGGDPGQTYYWRTELDLPDGVGYSNVVSLTLPLVDGPNAPTVVVQFVTDSSVAARQTSNYADPFARPHIGIDWRVLNLSMEVVAEVQGIEIDTQSLWRTVSVEGLTPPATEFYIQARNWADGTFEGEPAAIPGAWSPLVPFTLFAEAIPDPPPPEPEESFESVSGMTLFREWPFAQWMATASYRPFGTLPFPGNPVFIDTLVYRMDTNDLIHDRRTAAGSLVQHFGALVPGIPLRVETRYHYTRSSPFQLRRLPTRVSLLAVPRVLEPPYLKSLGTLPSRLVGGANFSGLLSIQLVSNDHPAFQDRDIIVDGNWAIEVSRNDGQTWQLLTSNWRPPLLDDGYTVDSEYPAFVWDLSGVAPGSARLRFRTETPGGNSSWRMSPSFYINMTSGPFFTDRRGDALQLSDFTTAIDEPSEWTQRGTGHDRTVRFKSLAGGTILGHRGGIATLNGIGQPRSFTETIVGQFASGATNSWMDRFLNDMASEWGTVAYGSGAPVSGLGGQLSSVFGAWGRWITNYMGWASHMWWTAGTGFRYGLGTMRPRLNNFTSGFVDEFWHLGANGQRQWLKDSAAVVPSALSPWYTVRTRYTLLNRLPNGNHQVRVESEFYGPEADTHSGGFQTQGIIQTRDWPCASCGFQAGGRLGTAVDFAAISVQIDSWGECEHPALPPVGHPCLLEATLYKEDREEIDWQVTDTAGYLGDSGDARAYMIQPFNYGEQILDFIRGSATISQVSFSIIDFISNLTGQYNVDKQFGWLTTKLSENLDNFRSAIQGRRLRLRRFISELAGWITVGDGPASAPQMESYSQYQLTIRDSREWERKLPISQSPQLAVFPPGPLEPWGDGMVAASPIITGFFEVDEEIYGPDAGYFYVGSGHWISGVPSSPSSWFVPKYLIYGEAQASVNAPELIDGVLRYSKVMIRWRYNGDTDEQWRYVRNIETANGYASWPLFGFSEGRYTHPEHGTQTVQAVRNAWATFRQDGGYEVPLHDIGSTSIQFQVLYVGHTNELFPLLIDGLTLGEFIRDVYDGKYSPTDPQGNIVPTGIRYDETEVLKLTQPIRARLTSTIDDARAWLETNGYAVVGYTPAFDHDLLIAPLGDRVPSSAEELAALTIIDETITEPSPTWAHGDRVINVLQFTYPRFFIDEESQAVDGLGRTEITISRQNLQSSFRNGVKVVQLSTELFASLGEDASTPLEEVDYAEILAEDRRLNLFNRYRFGTPAFQINVFRIATFHMRAGQFARFSLSWFPDYYKQSRSMDVIGHIIAIADLDCNLRRFTVEVVAPWPDDAS